MAGPPKTPSNVLELFGKSTAQSADWKKVVADQQCPFSGTRCFKVRKSDSSVSIGTCTVRYPKTGDPLLICPNRLLDKRQVFTDCLHLLPRHQPGNAYHLVSEVTVPGGSVDYFLVSAKAGKPVDFVGIEFQTMDTTGTVWPARQEFLRSVGLPAPIAPADANKSYGVNWKMTAKTILMQLHHKTETFEAVGRNFVLVVQDRFMDYMMKEFSFGHVTDPAVIADSVHFHAYTAAQDAAGDVNLVLAKRRSTTAEGVAQALNLGVTAGVDESKIMDAISKKMSASTVWTPV